MRRMKFASRKLLKVFIALSLLSLFADIVYEGARSIGGAYLNLLAAPAIAAGILYFGELLSYVMRLVGGLAAYRVSSGKMYWILILLGYGMNVFIPLLALAGSWELALMLFFLERLGKGIRAPPRDVILAEVTEGIGRGRGFGIHELLDQIGAVTGPILVSAMILTQGAPAGYMTAFWILWIPLILSLSMLGVAMKIYPEPKAVAAIREREERRPLGRRFWTFLAGSILMMMGFVYWQVIGYYAKDLVSLGIITDPEIPILYLVAMAVDAAIAVPIGMFYDKIGVRSLIIAPITAILITPTLFLVAGRAGLYLAAVFWGLTMGAMETIMRAAVADLTPIESRSLGYGVYSSGVGLSGTIGAVIPALLYDLRLITPIIAICSVFELAAIIVFATLPKARAS